MAHHLFVYIFSPTTYIADPSHQTAPWFVSLKTLDPLDHPRSKLAMASSLKMICIAIALAATALLFAAPRAQAWNTDMVPVWPPFDGLTAIPGGGAAGAPVCLQCRCCSRSNPSSCQMTNCCSTFNCDPAGKCNLVQRKCGCNGC
uniref:Uncharacterized protein n=1 Tax=Avena sativa TaxID=4498 RepID=A0ACD5U7A5_AVESA